MDMNISYFDSDFNLEFQEIYDKLNLTTKANENEESKEKYKNKKYSFLQTLYQMLQESEEKGFSSIIKWLDEESFKVYQKDKMSEVLSKYFKHNKILSFYRQLNIYGFQKTSYGEDKGTFRHENFIRYQPHRIDLIERVPIKSKSREESSISESVEDENEDLSFDFDLDDLYEKLSSTSSSASFENINSQNNQLSKFSFPQALYEMLQNSDQGEYASIISWTFDGFGFQIHKREKFSMILGQYFRHNNIQSFYRQLNIYGFQRVLSGPDKGAFKNKYFIRNLPEFIELIKRVPVKKGYSFDMNESGV